MAEEALKINYILNPFYYEGSGDGSTPQRLVVSDEAVFCPIFNCSPSKHTKSLNTTVGDIVKEFLTCFKSSMSPRLRSQFLHHILKRAIVEDEGYEFFKFVNSDFLASTTSAMKTLFKQRKHNLIYHLGKCFEGADPRMALDQMTYGLIDYNICFFAINNTRKLGMEEHYVSWLQTMFAHFGHKWLCLHRGPA